MASIQLTLMTLNVVGFVTFGQEPDNIDLIIQVQRVKPRYIWFRMVSQEPEIEFYAKRGKVLLFGSPGYPQYMKAGEHTSFFSFFSKKIIQN